MVGSSFSEHTSMFRSRRSSLAGGPAVEPKNHDKRVLVVKYNTVNSKDDLGAQ